jgi:2-desacetyl-2-hydroxyethyl bacteriochlorophyllide A dehydrogenase
VRALVITGPREAAVADVPDPAAGPGDVLVDVHRVGLCGTDVAFFTGEMPFLHDGRARYPMRIGHEWMGVVAGVGEGVAAELLGQRVTGDTMLGCQGCGRCSAGRQHTCADRFEVGVLGGFDGALAERVVVPATSLFVLPDSVDDASGAMVEPSGNAFRSLTASRVLPGDDLLIIGPGTLGLVAAMAAHARGVNVHLVGRSDRGLDFARSLGIGTVSTWEGIPDRPYRAVINASTTDVVGRALEWIEPGGTIVCVGLSHEPAMLDTRELVFNDLSVVGILSGSPGMQTTIDAFASGEVDPHPLIAATYGMDRAAEILSGARPPGSGPGPKFLIDPRM